MKSAGLVLAAAAMCGAATFATAGEIAPGDVKIVDGELATALTETAADPALGRKAFADRGLGNCLACHANPEMTDHQFHGDVKTKLKKLKKIKIRRN